MNHTQNQSKQIRFCFLSNENAQTRTAVFVLDRIGGTPEGVTITRSTVHIFKTTTKNNGRSKNEIGQLLKQGESAIRARGPSDLRYDPLCNPTLTPTTDWSKFLLNLVVKGFPWQ